ncbi:MAG TPA: TonB-dependent receptor [Gemmatimonadaceae bacterium]|nr:TonB-dependent receptor [Gemmatimonadaceae bacterium]
MSRARLAATLAFVAAAILAPRWARAQSITGTVESGGQPLVGASVRVLELDRIVRTGARGHFRFDAVPSGTYRVFVGLSGYATQTDTVVVGRAAVTLVFDLRQTAIPLEQIVVSASPTARTADEEYQSAESKSRAEFDNAAGMSFAEKLSDLPGVSVRGNGSAPSRPILRGLGDNEVSVLENGLRMGDIATYDPAHATPIDALSVAQVDVVRGPSAILYGPNTLGGLVNLVTNIVPTASDHPMSGTVAVEGNSVSNEYSGYVHNVYSSGNSAFGVSAGAVHSGDIGIPKGIYTDPGTGAQFDLRRIPQSDNRSSEAGAGYSYQGDFGTIGVGARHYEMNYGIPGVPPNPDWANVPPTTSRISQQRNTAELRSLFNVAGGWVQRVKFNAAYNDYNHSEFPTAQDSSGVSDPQANHFHKTDFNAMLQLQQRAVGQWSGTVGLWSDVQNMTISGDQPLGPNSTTDDFAAFAYEEFHAAPRTRLQAGARVDVNGIQTQPYPASTDSVFRTSHESRRHSAFTASLGAVQDFTPHWIGSLSLARSFRAPTVQELFADGLDAPSGTYTVGTSTLGPETGLGVDASIKGDYGRAKFEFSPYVNYLDHYIYGFLRGDTIQDFPVRQFSSTKARLMGFEAAMTVEPADHWALRASSDYVNGQDTRAGVPLPFMPPLRGLVRASYENERYSGMIEWRGAAAQHRLGDGDTPTAGYGLLDLGVGMRLVMGGTVSELGLHLDNALNTLYRDNLSVIKDFVPQPGRGVRLNYTLLY